MRELARISVALSILSLGCGGARTPASQTAAPPPRSMASGVSGSGRTPEDPIRACHAITPRTDYAAVASYRCPDGSQPLGGDPTRGAHARVGNVGAGPDGHILDLYAIPCASGTVQVYVDMYHCPAGVEAEPDMTNLTRAQLGALAQGIRSIHRDPFSPRAYEMRRGLLQWIVATPQVSVVLCTGLAPYLPASDTHAYSAELMLSMAAAVIEDGRDPADPVTTNVAAIHGLLVYYQALMADGATTHDPQLDALLAAALNGSLPGLVASIVSGCDLTHMGVHFAR